jgi:uncharacterized membrane protein
MAGAMEMARLLLAGVLAGVFLCSAMVEHAERTLGAAEWIAYKQAKERLFGPVMPAFFGLTLVAAVLVALFFQPMPASWGVVALLVAALLVTVIVHLPLNRVFQGWTVASHPADWDDARRRWRNWNWLRCILAVGAFALTVLAAR